MPVEKRNQSIDLIKIIAMLGVISLHCNMDRLDNMVAYSISRIAGISIPLFFIVSGFLLYEKVGSWKYSIEKILGIIRYVFLCCLVFSIVYIIVNLKFNVNLLGIFLSSFIQKGPFWMFWYFGAMCFIYILLPLLKWADNHFNYFYFYFLSCLLCIDFMVFILTYTTHWEYNVIQSFRLWNWLTYFSLGAIARKYNLQISVNGLIVLISAFVFVAFVYSCRKQIGGIEYFFTTPVCVCYAMLLFLKIISMRIQNSTIISKLSNLFLPVYTIHFFVIVLFRKLFTCQYLGLWTPLFDYLFITVVTLLFCYLIMQNRLAKLFFRI